MVGPEGELSEASASDCAFSAVTRSSSSTASSSDRDLRPRRSISAARARNISLCLFIRSNFACWAARRSNNFCCSRLAASQDSVSSRSVRSRRAHSDEEGPQTSHLMLPPARIHSAQRSESEETTHTRRGSLRQREQEGMIKPFFATRAERLIRRSLIVFVRCGGMMKEEEEAWPSNEVPLPVF